MVCPNCGTELEDGKVYCAVCGTEVFVVPDFEPEIEHEVNHVLDKISKEIHFDTLADLIPEVEIGKKRIPKRVIAAIAVIFIILLVLLGILIYCDKSPDFLARKGDKELANGSLKTAIEYYVKALDREPTSLDNRIKLADCYLQMEDVEAAVDVYKNHIAFVPEDKFAYSQIIAIYEERGSYDRIAEFLQYYSNDDIREDFKNYCASDVEFSVEEGAYDESIYLQLLAFGDGTIYYTQDGTLPGEDSNVYNAPIILKKGDFTVSAIYENEFGVFSSIVVKKYQVRANLPDAPAVVPDSGFFTLPDSIIAYASNGESIYYTMDGTEPDATKSIYGNPIPIPVGETVFKFAAINEKGESSDTVTRTYNLNIVSVYNQEQCLEILLNKLVDLQYITDIEGHQQGREGRLTYIYDSARQILNLSMYCFNEYYMPTAVSKDMSGNVFGVDMMTGNVYMIVKSSDGSYSLNILGN